MKGLDVSPLLKAYFSPDISRSLSSVLSLPQRVSHMLFAKPKWLCAQRQREWRNAWETVMLGRQRRGVCACVCARRGGYKWEMSCSDVTSAVSRQDAGMCHTDEGRGRMGEKSKWTRWNGLIFFPPTKLLVYLWSLQRLSTMEAQLLPAEMLMSVCGMRQKADAELFESIFEPS